MASAQEWKRTLERWRVASGAKAKRMTQQGEREYTSLGKRKGRFVVPACDVAAFESAYVRALRAGVALHMTEKQGVASPVLVDVDIRYPPQAAPPNIAGAIEMFATAYSGALAELVPGLAGQRCWVFERERAATEAAGKGGWHMMYPGVRVSAGARAAARERVVSNPEVAALFAGLGATNAVTDIVDAAVVSRNNWFVYGSSKEGCPAYGVSRVYEVVDGRGAIERVTSQPETDEAELVRLLSVSGEVESVPTTVPMTVLTGDVSHPKRGAARAALARAVVQARGATATAASEGGGRDTVKALVELLNGRRADAYDEW